MTLSNSPDVSPDPAELDDDDTPNDPGNEDPGSIEGRDALVPLIEEEDAP